MKTRQQIHRAVVVKTGRRPGLVLVIVMIVVVMISLAGYGFVTSMSGENKSVHLRGEQLQMEYAIASAEEFLKQHLSRPKVDELTKQPVDNEQRSVDEEALFRGVVVDDDDGPRGRVRFTVIAPHYDETGMEKWRYGLERESARLDLGLVMRWESEQPGAGSRALMALPGMTESIADAILDWMDSDNTARQSGSERDFYLALNPPYEPRNGVPDSIEELLLIKGVTRTLLFGRDANQNHRLDLEEQSQSQGPSTSEMQGERQIAWAELLTLFSAERDEDHLGNPRVDLNEIHLPSLHQKLLSIVEPEVAAYVILYRQYGPFPGTVAAASIADLQPNFLIPPRYLLRSPLDLVQSRVQVMVPNQPTRVINSPLPTEPEKLDEILGTIYDRCTTSLTSTPRGRVNVNLAPPEVLRAIPGIDKSLAEQIVTSRGTGTKDGRGRDKHPYWPFVEGSVGLEQMKQISPYVTVGGDVYRTQIIAFSETSRLSQRVEVVYDATREPVRRVFWKDLQVLKRGYTWDVLDTPGGYTTSQSGASSATFNRN